MFSIVMFSDGDRRKRLLGSFDNESVLLCMSNADQYVVVCVCCRKDCRTNT